MPQSPFELPPEVAYRLHRIGLADEAGGLVAPPDGRSEPDQFKVMLTPLARKDWQFLALARNPGARMQLHEMLSEGLERLRTASWGARDFALVGSSGQVFSQRRLCWVLRVDQSKATIIVHAIVRPQLNPFRCIWRYFDQRKALDLLRTNQLYLRRLDLLQDHFEARPTRPMTAARNLALSQVFGPIPSAFQRAYEFQRRALYICCWHKSEEESPQMWTDYCGDYGGFALQSTERLLQHQYAQMCEGREGLFFREIEYVDHATYDPISHGIPAQAFLKQLKFGHEKEIRFAWFAMDSISGSEVEIEAKLAALAESRRLPFDLGAVVERIVLNPIDPQNFHQEMRESLQQQHPELLSRIVISAHARR